MIRPDDPRVTLLIRPAKESRVQQADINQLIQEVDLALLAGQTFPIHVHDTTQLASYSAATIVSVAQLYRQVGWDLRVKPIAGVLYLFQGRRSNRVIGPEDSRVQSLLEARPPRVESPFAKHPPHDPQGDADANTLIEVVRRALLSETYLPIDICQTSYYQFSPDIVMHVGKLYEDAGWDLRIQPRPGVLYHIVGRRA